VEGKITLVMLTETVLPIARERSGQSFGEDEQGEREAVDIGHSSLLPLFRVYPPKQSNEGRHVPAARQTTADDMDLRIRNAALWKLRSGCCASGPTSCARSGTAGRRRPSDWHCQNQSQRATRLPPSSRCLDRSRQPQRACRASRFLCRASQRGGTGCRSDAARDQPAPLCADQHRDRAEAVPDHQQRRGSGRHAAPQLSEGGEGFVLPGGGALLPCRTRKERDGCVRSERLHPCRRWRSTSW